MNDIEEKKTQVIELAAEGLPEFLDEMTQVMSDVAADMSILAENQTSPLQKVYTEEDVKAFFGPNYTKTALHGYMNAEVFFATLEEELGALYNKQEFGIIVETDNDGEKVDSNHLLFESSGMQYCMEIRWGRKSSSEFRLMYDGEEYKGKTIRNITLAFSSLNCDTECSVGVVSAFNKARKKSTLVVEYKNMEMLSFHYHIGGDVRQGRTIDRIKSKSMQITPDVINNSYTAPTVKVGSSEYKIPMMPFLEYLGSDESKGKNTVVCAPAGSGKSTLLKYITSMRNREVLKITSEDLGFLSTAEGRRILVEWLSDSDNHSGVPIIFFDEAQTITPSDPTMTVLYDIMDGSYKSICPGLSVILAINSRTEDLDPVLVRPGRAHHIVTLEGLTRSMVMNLAKSLTGVSLDMDFINQHFKTNNTITLAEVFNGSAPKEKDIFKEKFAAFKIETV